MSSAVDTARADIEAAIASAWAGQTQIQWADRPFTVPDAAYLRVSILWGDGFPLTMGASGVAQNRLIGIVDGSLFAPENDGLGALESYADDFRNALNETIHGTARFGVCAGPAFVGIRHGYAQLAVTAPFEVIEVTA